jgi:hypothetical protein
VKKKLEFISNLPNRNDDIAELIKAYCWCNGMLVKWSIGLTDNVTINCDKHWECATEKEASETKKYMLNNRSLMHDLGGGGKYIYVRKL